jgi:hypothetical protein
MPSDNDWDRQDLHISRSFPSTGTPLEDNCPCPQEPCGHVRRDRVVDECQQHPISRMKTLRSVHTPEECPGKRVATT